MYPGEISKSIENKLHVGFNFENVLEALIKPLHRRRPRAGCHFKPESYTEFYSFYSEMKNEAHGGTGKGEKK